MYTASDIFDYTWQQYYENGHDYDYYRKESRGKFLIFLLLISLVLIFTGLFLIALSFVISSFIIRHYYLKHKEKVDKGYAAKRREKEEQRIETERRMEKPVAPANVFRDSGNRNNVVDLSNWIIGSEEARLIQSRISNDALCSSIDISTMGKDHQFLELELDKVYKEIDLNKTPALDSYISGGKFKYLDIE